MSREPQRRELHACGVRISYLEWGVPQAGRPSLLLLHGLIAEAATFRKLVAALPAEQHAIALDLPGAGYSDRPLDADITFNGFAIILHEAIEQLGLRGVVLLGHSHGGALALRLAASYPGLCSRLVLLCPAHPFSEKERTLVRFYLTPIGKLFAYSLPFFPRWAHMLAFRTMPGSRSSFGYADLEPYLHTLRHPGTVAHLLRLLESWEVDMRRLGHDLSVKPIATPTLLLWGDHDLIVPLSRSEHLLPHLEDATLVVMHGAGHLPNEEMPEDTARVLTGWLSSHRPITTAM